MQHLYLQFWKNIYLTFKEMTFGSLNKNDYDFGALDIEFAFVNNVTKKDYPVFYKMLLG